MGYCIVTRYHGPTNYRGSRIIATGPAIRSDGPMTRATVGWDYAVDSAENHARAATAVLAKLQSAGWRVTVTQRGATLPDDRGMVWTLDYSTD
jgi:hypothetical protein